ncbi:HAD family hydrolase [Pseudomonas qingdaonensis]|uniref:HAD family hydrolase n=1 Tax=Pseudomonas qingdaonensis TaxID=2056231 RepID=UPI0028AFAE5D|nr:HAD family hydrolase [Pseudomonas qingdaonensis]
MITAVLFDAFGTLVSIHRPTHPFRQLLQEGRRQGRKPHQDDVRSIMTQRPSLAEAASAFGISVTSASLARLERCLEEELASIKPFLDALPAVEALQGAGVRVGVCSNLAAAYGPAIHRIFPHLDAYGFSYQLGAMKPDQAIYKGTCDLLGVNPGHGVETGDRVLMIGDSARCDHDRPLEVGITGFLLQRRGAGRFSNLLDFAHAVIEGSQQDRTDRR